MKTRKKTSIPMQRETNATNVTRTSISLEILRLPDPGYTLLYLWAHPSRFCRELRPAISTKRYANE